jgi:hypothetical protein
MFPRDMVCLRYRSVDTLHKGDTEDDDDDDDNNNNKLLLLLLLLLLFLLSQAYSSWYTFS